MTTIKITYWITTGLIVLGMLLDVYSYFFYPPMKVSFVHLGFPDWMRIELANAKLIGLLALGVPIIPARIKEWAYAGFFIIFFSAFLAHHEVGDSVVNQVAPLIFLLLLVISYITFHKVVINNKAVN